jgi:hypothetical protein
MDLEQRISKLNPAQRKLLELKLTQQGSPTPDIANPGLQRSTDDRIPLTTEQQTWWCSGEPDPLDPAYDVTGPVSLEGPLDFKLMERCINEVIKRHEILRTVFITEKGRPLQVVLPSLTLRLNRLDFRGYSPEEQEIRMKQLAGDNTLYRFDLRSGPLVKILLVERARDKYYLITVMHHLISDLLSLKIFLKEVAWFYVTYQSGKPPGFALPRLTEQYGDYACQQQQSRDSAAGREALREQQQFWLEMFKGDIPRLKLPGDFPEPARKSYEGDHAFFVVKEDKINALKEIFLKENATLYVMVLTLLYVFLARLSGEEDIVVGTLVNTRQNTALHNMIGVFVKKVPLRCYPRGEKTVNGFLTEVNRQVLRLYENQDYPYAELLDKILAERNTRGTPLFNVLLNFIYIDISEIGMPGLTVKPYTLKNNRVGCDLELVCEGTYKELFFKLSYRTKLFKKETIHAFTSYFQQIIDAVIENPQVKISDLETIPKKKREEFEV